MTHPNLAETAHCLKQLLIESSPLIEEYTGKVCPTCIDVCCRQRHGLFTGTDHTYISELNEAVPPHDPSRSPDGPCQFLTTSGCAKPRWYRAWKCTWYFCEPLLQALHEGPQKKARQLSAALEKMGHLYGTIKGE